MVEVGTDVVVIWTIRVTSTLIKVGVTSILWETPLQDVKSTTNRQVKSIGVFMNHDLVLKRFSRLTVGVTGAGADVDSVWEQEKPEARKMLENAAESPASSARCVRRSIELGDYTAAHFYAPQPVPMATKIEKKPTRIEMPIRVKPINL